MTTSPEIKQLCTALVEFHKAVGKISKDAKNPFFKSAYASLSNILDAIHEPLLSNGLCIMQFPEGANGLTTRIVHVSGEFMEATYEMKPVKDSPQDRGSAITYQRRYAIGAILSLNIDEDDDGNKASQPDKKQSKPNPEVISPYDLEAINMCNSLVELTALYNVNKDHFDKSPIILREMKRRKSEINSHATA